MHTSNKWIEDGCVVLQVYLDKRKWGSCEEKLLEGNVAISVLKSHGTLKNFEIRILNLGKKKTILKISLELTKWRIFGATGYKKYQNIYN